MNSHERVFDELNQAIGNWATTNSSSAAEFPPDPEPIWSEIDEDAFPPRPIRSDSRTGSEDSDVPVPAVTNNSSISEAVIDHGLDALAFYKSFRYRYLKPYIGKWGIFYFDSALSFISRLTRIYIQDDNGSSSALALKFIRQHEQYHFKIDSLALVSEPTLQRHLYLPYRNAYKHCQSNCVEEALANAAAWRFAKREDRNYPGFKAFAEEFLSNQPNAYSRFRESEPGLAAELAENLVNQNFCRHTAPTLKNWALQTPKIMSSRFAPEYIISSITSRTLFPAAKIFPNIAEIRDSEQVKKRLSRENSEFASKWEKTKEKIMAHPALGGLDFKPWPKLRGAWSVRIDGSLRAHLMPEKAEHKVWTAVELGSHEKMKH